MKDGPDATPINVPAFACGALLTGLIWQLSFDSPSGAHGQAERGVHAAETLASGDAGTEARALPRRRLAHQELP